jgi:hypothetical protein
MITLRVHEIKEKRRNLGVPLTPPGTSIGTFTVAKESTALRAIYLDINHQDTVESIIDPGSEIIAMSKDICHDLGLSYNPTIHMNLTSANGEVDQSLGLSCNVPCHIADITLFLQIHIVQKPAYNILLG